MLFDLSEISPSQRYDPGDRAARRENKDMEPTVDLAEGAESRFTVVLPIVGPDDRSIEFEPRNNPSDTPI
jgi:hypothetical protein